MPYYNICFAICQEVFQRILKSSFQGTRIHSLIGLPRLTKLSLSPLDLSLLYYTLRCLSTLFKKYTCIQFKKILDVYTSKVKKMKGRFYSPFPSWIAFALALRSASFLALASFFAFASASFSAFSFKCIWYDSASP